eukprot:TRINITY_DN70685_c0_g1_i1.p1 TRINITY_DN70685_c0_g1~~TRINITY_DN70685_c0_g1_i1.p1  ORF type:complete len:433 (+),score=89.27 TRINITY_DN70685_c0_g1_i1:76-1374(+)
MPGPTTIKWPIAVAFAVGAVLAKVFLVGEIQLPKPTRAAGPEADDCAPPRPGKYQGEKELLIGQRPQLKAGALNDILERVDNGTVILSFGSAAYTAPLVNWLARLTDLGIRNYAIVCLDEGLMGWLNERKSRCQYMLTDWKHGVWTEQADTVCEGGRRTSDNSLATCKSGCILDVDCRAIAWRSQCMRCPKGYTTKIQSGTELFVKMTTETLWWARWKLLVRLLNANVNVLMSDLDAMFLRNPLPVLHSLAGGVDVLAQRGTFPDSLSKKWGSALCMGFSFWRPTPDVKRFVVPMTSVIEASGDDQVGLNVALDKADVMWDQTRLEFERASAMNVGTTRLGLKVGLLSHTQFPRKCEVYSEADVMNQGVVAHCFEPQKSGDAKQRLAQKYKLWVLRDDWEHAVDPNTAQSFDEYLKMVQIPSISEYGRGGAD